MSLIPLCAPESAAAINPDWFFADLRSPEGRQAKALCLACPVQDTCASYALDEGVPFGTWGGLGKEDREKVWKRRGSGRPTAFVDAIDAGTGPLLQARRDYEKFDERQRVLLARSDQMKAERLERRAG